MVIETQENGDLYVMLTSGGLAKNLLALYPDIDEDALASLTTKVWNDNSTTLYSPDVYTVGNTYITIYHLEVAVEHTPSNG